LPDAAARRGRHGGEKALVQRVRPRRGGGRTLRRPRGGRRADDPEHLGGEPRIGIGEVPQAEDIVAASNDPSLNGSASASHNHERHRPNAGLRSSTRSMPSEEVTPRSAPRR
jgi:hypothetical protein